MDSQFFHLLFFENAPGLALNKKIILKQTSISNKFFTVCIFFTAVIFILNVSVSLHRAFGRADNILLIFSFDYLNDGGWFPGSAP
jgi:hypothetical protein